MQKDEFCTRFIAHMVKMAPFQTFDDGGTVREYAEATAPTYFDDPLFRVDGPEQCAESDITCWDD